MPKDDLTLRSVKGSPLTFEEGDANFNRLGYFSGDWSAGTYEPNEIVKHFGGVYICVQTTTDDPYSGVGTTWELLATTPGRAAMDSVGQVSGADITAAYQTLTFDNDYPYEVGVVTDPAAGTFQMVHAGLWQINLFLSFGHNESNSSRQTRVRIFNVTDGIAGSGVTIPISRNQPSTIFQYTTLFQVTSSEIGDIIRWEIGGADSLTSVVWESKESQFLQVSAI